MRSRSKREDDLAVSEVIGVVMLLAMVITMMGGVFVFLTPYVNDLIPLGPMLMGLLKDWTAESML